MMDTLSTGYTAYHFILHTKFGILCLTLYFLAFLDYSTTNESLLIGAGETCVDIEILDDLEVERTEQFNTYLAIATSTGAKVLHGCEYILIYDNDGE